MEDTIKNELKKIMLLLAGSGYNKVEYLPANYKLKGNEKVVSIENYMDLFGWYTNRIEKMKVEDNNLLCVYRLTTRVYPKLVILIYNLINSKSEEEYANNMLSLLEYRYSDDFKTIEEKEKELDKKLRDHSIKEMVTYRNGTIEEQNEQYIITLSQYREFKELKEIKKNNKRIDPKILLDYYNEVMNILSEEKTLFIEKQKELIRTKNKDIDVSVE